MTTYIGVDLAWSRKNRSGLAAVDESGVLLDLRDATEDEEILEWIAQYADDCLVAIDAPIVVTNEAGQRPCERDVSAVFRRFNAGTHPTNLAKPEFADGSRALALCEQAGLEIDPATKATRRAIEVYPHPATITLFGLDVVIPYKHKSGRDFEDLQASLIELVEHLESLREAVPPLVLDGSPAWAEAVSAIRSATQKSHLRSTEDRVDAVLCAYVGLLRNQAPERTRVIGDVDSGYIVVPVDDRVRDQIDELEWAWVAGDLLAPPTAATPMLVQLDEFSAVVLGEGSLGDLELVEPPLLSVQENRNLAGAISLGLGATNLGGQAAMALPQMRGLVRLAPETIKQLATNSPVTSGGWNLGILNGPGSQFSHQIRWAPAHSASSVSLIASLGPAAALMGLQLQLNQIAKSVEEGTALTRQVQKTLDREHQSEVSASYETVMKALREAIHIHAVTRSVWDNIAGHEAALRKQQVRELDAVRQLARDLGAQTKAKTRRAWVSEHALDLMDHLNSLREAHAAWFTYQALRAHHVAQLGDETGLVDHVTATARSEYDEALEELRGVSARLTRLCGMLQDLPASKLDKLKGQAAGKSMAETLAVLARLNQTINLLPTGDSEPVAQPDPSIRVAKDHADTDAVLKVVRWQLEPGERIIAIAEGSQTALTSWLLVTDARITLMRQSDLFDGDDAEWVSNDDIRYVRARSERFNRLYPLDLTITTRDRDLACAFGRWAQEDEAAGDLDQLMTLLRSMMVLPASEVPGSPLIGGESDRH